MSATTPELSRAARCRLLTLAVAILLGGTAAEAELAVLAGGHVLPVERYLAAGERITLELRGGGRLVLPIDRVERVVDDEIDHRPPSEWQVEFTISPGFVADPGLPELPYGGLIYEAARRHAVHPALVAAIVRAESAFDAAAISRAGARGLMQLMPATGERFGVAFERLHDPESNLAAGTAYLAWLLRRFDGDIALALAGYNAGEQVVERHQGVPPYRETHDYLHRIARILESWTGPISRRSTVGG